MLARCSERVVARAGLDAYYAAHPDARPTLAEITRFQMRRENDVMRLEQR
mgnify:CR=1 FL=1